MSAGSNLPRALACGTLSHVHGARSVNAFAPPLSIGARLAAPGSYDASARTVQLIAATETAVLLPGWMVGLYDVDSYYEILACSPDAVDLSQVQAGNAPLLDTHDRFELVSRLGVVRSAQIDANQVVTLCAFGQSDEARTAEAEFAGGTPPKVSVGYRRNQMILTGMIEEIPVYTVTSWILTEVSLVSIAADPNAGVRSAHVPGSPSLTQEHSMTSLNSGVAAPALVPAASLAMAGRTFPPSIGTRGPAPQAPAAPAAAPASAPAPAVASQPSPAPAAPAHQPETPPSTVQPAPAPAPTAAAEGTRAAVPDRFSASNALALVDMARSFGDAVATRAQEVVQQNERGEIGTDAARTAILQAAADAQRTAGAGINGGGRAVEITADEQDKWRTGAVNSIIQRAGLAQLIQDGARSRGQAVPDLDPGEMRGIHNAELARMSLERAGQRVATFDRDAIVGQAMALRMGPYQGTSDFPVILEQVVNRVLQAAYATTPDTWRLFAGIGSVSDFKPTAMIRSGSFGALDPLQENGEIKNKAIPDGAKTTIQAGTRANIIGLTRQAIVNDDLGAFNEMAVTVGRAGKLAIELDIYALLAMNGGFGPIMSDGKTFFHADHGNIVSPGGDISIDQLEAMDFLFAAQTDISGNEPLDIPLAVHLVPYNLKGKATVINSTPTALDPSGKVMIPNRVNGLFDTIVPSKRMRGTRRYGFADPNIAPALKVVFLNGNQEPQVQTRDGWRTDGVEWRVVLDYGVGAIDWRTAVTDSGSAQA